MTDTPPDWVLLEAAKRCGYDWELMSLRMEYEMNPMFRALCDMIERYEQPPVDRKLLCAREAWQQSVKMAGHMEDEVDCPDEWIGIRAIELWEEGFGK